MVVYFEGIRIYKSITIERGRYVDQKIPPVCLSFFIYFLFVSGSCEMFYYLVHDVLTAVKM